MNKKNIIKLVKKYKTDDSCLEFFYLGYSKNEKFSKLNISHKLDMAFESLRTYINLSKDITIFNNELFGSVRTMMIDDNPWFVGKDIAEALGYKDGETVRMVKTPWFEEAIAFDEAAKVGTNKVINDHSTIGIVVTTDGSIVDNPRRNKEKAEEDVINALKEINKPFIVLLNSTNPTGQMAKKVKEDIEKTLKSQILKF